MADTTIEVMNPVFGAGGLAAGDLFYVFRPAVTDLDFNATPGDIVTFVEANATAFATSVHTHVLADITDAGTLAGLNSITDAEIAVGANIALSKLATDPLDRANHTGTSTMSTISDAGALATLNTVNLGLIDDITANNIVGSDGTGDVVALTPAQIRTLLNVVDGADVTNTTSVDAAGAVMETDFNAFTILTADVDDTPTPLTVPLNSLVGRKASGGITTLDASDLLTLVGVEAGAEANEFSFKTISVLLQDDIVADTTTDTLTFVGGTDITITTDAGTDTITITSTAAGVGDVVGPGTHTDNLLARYSGVNTNIIDAAGVSIDDFNNMAGLNDITLGGTVDGRDVATDGTKLDGIDVGAEVNQNAFKTIQVPSQNSIVADNSEDFLNITGGTNVTVTTNDVTDTLTISVPDGGSLGDVFAPATHGTNIVPVWDGVDSNTLKNSVVLITPVGDISGVKDITLTGTIDGRDVSVDGSKLDGIDAGAEVNEFSFKTIAVSGEDAIVADTDADTLTIVGGTNVTVTTDAGTDTLTISTTLVGTGDVTGPSIHVDNALARYDGIDSNTIQTSGILIDDLDNMSGINDITLAGTVDGRDVSVDGAKLDGIQSGAQITNTANVDSAGAVMETDFGAFTVLTADVNNTPLPLTVLASTFVGRKSTGGIVAMTPTEALAELGVDAGAEVNQNAFTTIAVSGQSDIVADIATDTLSIIAGTNITITTTPAADAMVINAAIPAGAGDVTGPAAHLDETMPRWNGDNTKALKTTGILISDLDDLSGVRDISLTGTVDGRDVSADGLLIDDAVLQADFNGFTILAADVDDTPLPITVAASTFVGRKSTGGIVAMTTAELLTEIGVTSGGEPNDPNTALTNITNTFIDAQIIDGAADEVQLTIQGHSTQLSEILVVEDSAGVDLFSVSNTGNVTLSGTVDGRDVSVDGSKLDGIEAGADVTDATNVNAAGAVMETDFNAFTVLAADVDDTPLPITVAPSTFVGRNSTGGITALTTGQAGTLLGVSGTNTGDQTITLTGDVTGSGTGSFAATIANNSVSLVKMADVATGTVFYRKTAGTGDPEVQTLSTLKTDLGVSGTNTGDQTITLTGDVTGSGTGSFAATVAASAITLAKMADVATGTVFYRKTAGTGVPEVQTITTLKTDLGVSGTNTGDQTITLTGDVTGSGTGSFTATIANDTVTNAKLSNMATATFKGRTTAGTGDPEDLTVAQAKTLLNLTGTNTGDQTITLTGDVTGSGTGSFPSTIANNAVTNAKAADMPTMTIKGRNVAGGGNPLDLTVAQVNTMLGASDAPIATATAIAATTVDFITGIDSSSALYILRWWDVTVTTDGAELWMRTDSNGGASWDAGSGDYEYIVFGMDGNENGVENGSIGDDHAVLVDNIGNATGECTSGTLNIWNPSNTSLTTIFDGQAVSINSLDEPEVQIISVIRDTGGSVNAIRITISSGTFSGEFALYKVVTS